MHLLIDQWSSVRTDLDRVLFSRRIDVKDLLYLLNQISVISILKVFETGAPLPSTPGTKIVAAFASVTKLSELSICFPPHYFTIFKARWFRSTNHVRVAFNLPFRSLSCPAETNSFPGGEGCAGVVCIFKTPTKVDRIPKLP